MSTVNLTASQWLNSLAGAAGQNLAIGGGKLVTPSPIISQIDPLIDSYRSYRARLQAQQEFLDTGVVLTTQTDEQMADAIRLYYSQRAVMWRLRDQEITPFRRDLVRFVTECVGPEYRWNSNYEGMIYRLPEFYHYDLHIDRMLDEHPGNGELDSRGNNTLELMPYAVMHKTSRSDPTYEFWFIHRGSKIVLPLKANNPLLHFWNRTFTDARFTGRSITVRGFYQSRTLGGFLHWSIRNKMEIVL